MKIILTILSVCFCTTLSAQINDTSQKEKEETASDIPFSWYLDQEEEKENFLEEKLHSLTVSNLKNLPVDPKKIAIILNVPAYKGPRGLSLMPELPLDTTNTNYFKIYPVRE